MTWSPEIMIHVAAGSIGFLSGAVALLVRKGAWLHRWAGKLFFLAMLPMALTGSWLALLMPQSGTAVGGILTLYMVATGFMTVRRHGRVGTFEIAAFVVALACAAAEAMLGMRALGDPKGMLEGVPAAPYFVFAAVAGLAATLDLSVMVRGGVSGIHRIARHLWRMCIALFFATGSFFTNGLARVLPHEWHRSPLLFVPLVVPLLMMVVWLLRLYFTSRGQSLVVRVAVAQSGETSP